MNPNRFQNSYEWRSLMMTWVSLWGNAFFLIIREMERPVELIPIHPDNVTVLFSEGKIFYRIENSEIFDKIMTFDSSNILHIKNLSTDGVVGKSPIRVLAENLGLGLASQRFGAQFYKNGAKLDAVITSPAQLSDDGLKNFRKSWRRTHERDGERIAFLDAGMEYQAIGVPPEESQFLQTRKFSVTDVARAFRVPPPLLYDLERATFSNITELILSFVKFTIAPWMINIESELNDKLLREDEKGTLTFKMNAEGLLRGDSKARSEFYQKLFAVGALSPNEIREKENMNPREGGDEFFIPLNFVSNEQAVTE